MYAFRHASPLGHRHVTNVGAIVAVAGLSIVVSAGNSYRHLWGAAAQEVLKSEGEKEYRDLLGRHR